MTDESIYSELLADYYRTNTSPSTKVIFQPQTLPDFIPVLAVMHLDHIGDILNTFSLVHHLRMQYPGARLLYITEPAFVALAKLNPDLDEVIGLPIRDAGTSRHAQFRQALDTLITAHIQVLLNLNTEIPGALAAALIQSPVVIGNRMRTPDTLEICGNAWTIYLTALHLPQLKHPATVVDPHYQHREFYRVGLPVSRQQFTLNVNPTLKNGAPHASPLIVLCPDCNRDMRKWGDDHYLELAQRLLAQDYNVQIVVPRNQHAAYKHRCELKGLPVPVSFPTLSEWAQQLQTADCVVTNDTGALHLAAAVGSRVLGLFGPSWPIQALPVSPAAHGLQADLPCAPCFSMDTCPNPHYKACLETLTPDLIFAAIDRLINGAAADPVSALAYYSDKEQVHGTDASKPAVTPEALIKWAWFVRLGQKSPAPFLMQSIPEAWAEQHTAISDAHTLIQNACLPLSEILAGHREPETLPALFDHWLETPWLYPIYLINQIRCLGIGKPFTPEGRLAFLAALESDLRAMRQSMERLEKLC